MRKNQNWDGLVTDEMFQSVIFDLISSTLVMDTHKNAQNYRKRMVEMNVSCPRIVTLDGYSVKSVLFLVDEFEALRSGYRSCAVEPDNDIAICAELEHSVKRRIKKYYHALQEYSYLNEQFEARRERLEKLTTQKLSLEKSLESLTVELLDLNTNDTSGNTFSQQSGGSRSVYSTHEQRGGAVYETDSGEESEEPLWILTLRYHHLL